MIITGGRLKGRKLPAVSASHDSLRPTGARQREMLFNILAHLPDFEFKGARVLDGFCGTGSFGFEALSRGAAHATFLDLERRALERISETANRYDLSRFCTSVCANALSPPPCKGAPAHLVFLDPPFHSGLALGAINALDANGWLDEEGIVVCELPKDSKNRKSSQKAAQSHDQMSDTAPNLIATTSTGFDHLMTRTCGASQFVMLCKRSPTKSRICEQNSAV